MLLIGADLNNKGLLIVTVLQVYGEQIAKLASKPLGITSCACKKDGYAQFCVDYRKLNSVTLQSLSGSKWFSH